MLKHRKEHFQQLSHQLDSLISEVADVAVKLPTVANNNDKEAASSSDLSIKTSDDDVASETPSPGQVKDFVSRLAIKMKQFQHGMALVESVPWPRDVLLADPNVIKVRFLLSSMLMCWCVCVFLPLQ